MWSVYVYFSLSCSNSFLDWWKIYIMLKKPFRMHSTWANTSYFSLGRNNWCTFGFACIVLNKMCTFHSLIKNHKITNLPSWKNVLINRTTNQLDESVRYYSKICECMLGQEFLSFGSYSSGIFKSFPGRLYKMVVTVDVVNHK